MTKPVIKVNSHFGLLRQPVRRAFLTIWCLLAIVLGACSDTGDAPPRIIVITATPVSTFTPVVIVVTASPEPPTPTLVPGFAGRLRKEGEGFSQSSPESVVATSTPMPMTEATRTPFPSPAPTLPPTAVPPTITSSVETPTSAPADMPTMTPTPFVCGYAEVVLINAGKTHKPCHTPTPTAAPIFYDTATPVPTRTAIPTSTPFIAMTPTPIPTATRDELDAAIDRLLGKAATPIPTPIAPTSSDQGTIDFSGPCSIDVERPGGVLHIPQSVDGVWSLHRECLKQEGRSTSGPSYMLSKYDTFKLPNLNGEPVHARLDVSVIVVSRNVV